MSNSSLPDGWKTMPLGDLLTPAAIDQLNEMIARFRDGSIIFVAGENLHTAILRRVLEPIAADLEAKGVLPRYLAYWLEDKFFGPAARQRGSQAGS